MEVIQDHIDNELDDAEKLTQAVIEQMHEAAAKKAKELEEKHHAKIKELQDKEDQIMKRELASNIRAKQLASERQKKELLKRKELELKHQRDGAATQQQKEKLMEEHKAFLAQFEEALERE